MMDTVSLEIHCQLTLSALTVLWTLMFFDVTGAFECFEFGFTLCCDPITGDVNTVARAGDPSSVDVLTTIFARMSTALFQDSFSSLNPEGRPSSHCWFGLY